VKDFALYREFSPTPIRQIETASLVVPLLIGFADPFEMALGREPRPDEDFQSFTAGLCMRPVMIRSAGGSSCLEITLTPLGARRFFGLPMSELTERMIRLDDLEDRSLSRLRQRLGNERDWTRRLAIAEAFVTRRLLGNEAPSPAVCVAYSAILRSRGRISVSRLAARVDWSRKHLARKFHDEIGLGPKSISRLARFSTVLEMAKGGDGWAGIAAECGYADQAHLTREFHELAGATPTAWLAGAA
jgi:AraC-like DNA-binding protein